MRCEATTRQGRPCQQRAMQGGRLCATHAGRGGAPRGNRYGLRHGLYSRYLSPREKLDLVAARAAEGLDEEIAVTRLMIQRALREKKLPPEAYARLVDALCRQLRLRRQLSGESTNRIADALATVLNEAAAELGLDG
jgi:hypothetical protein